MNTTLTESPLLGECCKTFLASKRADVDTGLLSPRTFDDYRRAVEKLEETLGAGTAVEALRPLDFERLGQQLAGSRGVAALGRDITMIRTALRYFSDYCGTPIVNTGPKFRKPSNLVKRRHRAKIREEHGLRLFTPGELRSLIANASIQMRAMIFLGINAGLNNSDLSNLPKSALNLVTRWLDYPRHKTAVPRRVPLWGETCRAIHVALLARKRPLLQEHEPLVFLSKHGRQMVRAELRGENVLRLADGITTGFNTLLRALGIYRPGLSFGALRHTFRTIADECKDTPAIDFIMGHAGSDNSIAGHYRERIADDRLVAVTEHVHNWLYGERRGDVSSD